MTGTNAAKLTSSKDTQVYRSCPLDFAGFKTTLTDSIGLITLSKQQLHFDVLPKPFVLEGVIQVRLAVDQPEVVLHGS